VSHLEIEKRYLCNGSKIITTLKKEQISYIITNIEQFYLKATKEETLRYRKDENRYIKNIKRGSGLVREELEVEVSKKEYKEAKAKNSAGVIKKKRYKFKLDGNLYELDIFKGKLEGLSIVEVEFKDIYQANNFKPTKLIESAIIKDITNEAIYSNGALSRSMKIPLREDSFLSLRELNFKELEKPKFDLYISDYEGANYAFKNSVERLLNSFAINIEQFLKNIEYKELKRANKALIRLKSLLLGHKSFMKNSSFDRILFNINSILLIFEEAITLQREFNTRLKNKANLAKAKQTKELKKLLEIAKKEKLARDKIVNSYKDEFLLNLKNSFDSIEFKSKIKKPFSYIKQKVLKKQSKSLKKELHKFNKIELYYNLLYFNNILHYFKEPPLKREFKELKKLIINGKSSKKLLKKIEEALNAY